MLPMVFEEIGSDGILDLIVGKISERKTLEYKQALTIATGDEKAEFLADISSFANASGGDIIFGISDERDAGGNPTGIPSAIVPLEIVNPATECGRIEQLIDSGIQPRIPLIQVRAVDIPGHGVVIIVRVGKSWIAPHMVTYANRSRFYSRNSSTGKVQLDVQQIGAAFTMQRSLGERLRAWKANRISQTMTGDGPIPLQGSRMLYHFVPAAALMADDQTYPRTFIPQKWAAYDVMGLSSYTPRYNADGYLMHQEMSTKRRSYWQVFRDGTLEFGSTEALSGLDEIVVASAIFEQKIIATFLGALMLLKDLKVAEPIFVTLTLTGMKGRKMALPTQFRYRSGLSESHLFDRDIICCPDVHVQSLTEQDPVVLLPIVNSIWQAAGLAQSPYISASGEWKPSY